MQALRARRPDLELIGRGGPRMAAIAGKNFLDWSEHSAVLGLWEVVRQYGYFRKEFRVAIEEIRAQKPDAVVLIDYPGFNLRLARALRNHSLGGKIIYYISPQVWAWNQRRIPQMARSLDLMLCIFPFEAELYNRSGLRTIFVGHPMMERLERASNFRRARTRSGRFVSRQPIARSAQDSSRHAGCGQEHFATQTTGAVRDCSRECTTGARNSVGPAHFGSAIRQD